MSAARQVGLLVAAMTVASCEGSTSDRGAGGSGESASLAAIPRSAEELFEDLQSRAKPPQVRRLPEGYGKAGFMLATEAIQEWNRSELLFALLEPKYLRQVDFVLGETDSTWGLESFRGFLNNPGAYVERNGYFVSGAKLSDLQLFSKDYSAFLERYPTPLTRQAAADEFMASLRRAHERYTEAVQQLKGELFVSHVGGLRLSDEMYSIEEHAFVLVPLGPLERLGEEVGGSAAQEAHVSLIEDRGWLVLPKGMSLEIRISTTVEEADALIALTEKHPGTVTYVYRFSGLHKWGPSARNHGWTGSVELLAYRAVVGEGELTRTVTAVAESPKGVT